jgi:hypothetical protein
MVRITIPGREIVAYGQVLRPNAGEESTHQVLTLADSVNLQALAPGKWTLAANGLSVTVFPPAVIETETPPAAILRAMLEDVEDFDDVTKAILDAMLQMLGG